MAAANVSGQVEAAPALDGFEQLASAGEVIEIRKPLFQSGKLRVGKAVGRVERRALGQSHGIGALGVDYKEMERFGSMRFVVTGAEVNGTLSGDCRYGRAEQRVGSGSWTAAFPTASLRMHCQFIRDGKPIGYLQLEGRPDASKLVQVVQREGEVVINGTRLTLRSEHRLGKRRIPTSGPVGFWVENEAGDRVGAIDTNGMTRVRLASTGNAGQRDANLAAALALAVFWDPGDTDDD
ncbi:hypothetical protein [Sphingomonas sp. LHG3406-1]|uniref:hypothetical protein n=1 Tax=Sphingomonas sp. LHG3406-1 TaxID=2804617 RepID=UPI00262D2FBE|nr:hypothetical protein [Sphingomonas sp. LHG3406-1]